MSYSSKEPGSSRNVEPLAGGELALAVLSVDPALAATEAGFGALLVENCVHRSVHRRGQLDPAYGRCRQK
jgi:hypothetical protein